MDEYAPEILGLELEGDAEEDQRQYQVEEPYRPRTEAEPDLVERRQMALKCSNGWWQALQKWSDLQAVEPNSLRVAVSVEPQKGQAWRRMVRPSWIGTIGSVGPGGAMP